MVNKVPKKNTADWREIWPRFRRNSLRRTCDASSGEFGSDGLSASLQEAFINLGISVALTHERTPRPLSHRALVEVKYCSSTPYLRAITLIEDRVDDRVKTSK